jgi:hypothetical protein
MVCEKEIYFCKVISLKSLKIILLGCPIVNSQVLRFGMQMGKQNREYDEEALID